MKASLLYCVALCVPGILAMTSSAVPHSRPRISKRDPAEDLTQQLQARSAVPDIAVVSRRGGSLSPRFQRQADELSGRV